MTPFVFALLFYAMLKSAAVTPSSRIFRSMCVSLDMTGMSLGLTGDAGREIFDHWGSLPHFQNGLNPAQPVRT